MWVRTTNHQMVNLAGAREVKAAAVRNIHENRWESTLCAEFLPGRAEAGNIAVETVILGTYDEQKQAEAALERVVAAIANGQTFLQI
jgi:hypothetical protein